MNNDRTTTILLCGAAIACGIAVGYFDSRPTWDDTGVTAGTVLFLTVMFGAIRPKLAWLFALAVGLPIVIIGFAVNGGFGLLLALAIAFVGAYAGALFRKFFGSGESTPGRDGDTREEA